MEIILDKKKHYTYADYLTWLDNKKRELLNGLVHLISPAPTLKHAKISRNILTSFVYHIKKNKGKCQTFAAPFDVRLPKDKETANDKIHTVVQPDICIVCDESKLDERGCLGAPDMIVEILSFSTQKYDLNDKFNIYEAAGVKEYWVISPKEKGVSVFILQENGKYDEGTNYLQEEGGEVPVQTLPGLNLSLEEIFED
ncbi:Uma2 family endonuclease [Bacteroides sp. 519]|uniref:Uma2 family endonuclease n=1 Tax=Bacteroides sp. 519 TaxID=2302937 RepID=UPI0013CF6FD1|nr:Uma2 family endonuclease [Bacteroides sp. 519]NDV59137.1 Uma2 family endonuclease [Bacteroides sp. 519]